jgi:hypothetical protein
MNSQTFARIAFACLMLSYVVLGHGDHGDHGDHKHSTRVGSHLAAEFEA